MKWYYGTILGSICLGFINGWSKTKDISLNTQLVVVIPLLLCNLGYWYGFRHAPSFLGCWYTGSAINALTAFGLSIFLFDRAITIYSVIGVVCVIAGQQLLMK